MTTIRKITVPRAPHESALAAVQRAYPGRRVSGRGGSGVRIDGILWDWSSTIEDYAVVLTPINGVLVHDGAASVHYWRE